MPRRSRRDVPKAHGRPRKGVDKFKAQRIWLPDATWEKARRAAELRGMPVSVWIRRVVENALLRIPDE